MQIVKPSVRVWFPKWEEVNTNNPENFDNLDDWIEDCARDCYQSHDRKVLKSAEKLIKSLIKRGHGAMLEFGLARVRIVTDRGVSHELVRHRIASFAQESTRYVKYDNVKFIYPVSVKTRAGIEAWRANCLASEQHYGDMIKAGEAPEAARHALNHSVATTINVQANFRSWLNIFSLRCAKEAHPHIRQVMMTILDVFNEHYPVIFGGLWGKYK